MQAAALRATFDRLAPDYDRLWTDAPAGRLQRASVWRALAPVIDTGQRVLDLGCGTGEDAAWLKRLGAQVTATDISAAMVSHAIARGVDARPLALEQLDSLEGSFDLALSNFGALNCVVDLDAVSRELARLVRPGGYAAICLAGRFCLWETAWYLLRLKPRKAVRRWNGSDFSQSLSIQVLYPTVSRLRQVFAPAFELASVTGIGICVPPSFVGTLPGALLDCFARIDRMISGVPLARALSDHRLLVFRRR